MSAISKRGVFILLCCSALCACYKNDSAGIAKATLTLSQAVVKRGEPLVASTNVITSNLVVRWNVNPSTAAWISASGNRSVFLFANAGVYTITANYFQDSLAGVPYDSSSSPVTVTDSIYNDSTGQWASCTALEQVPIPNNDQILLTPVSYSDTGMVFIAHTQLTYGNQYPLLDYSGIADTVSGYGFVFGTVTESSCSNSTAAPIPATAIITIKGLADGVSNLTFIVGGNVYKGTLTVSDTQCSFQWGYTSGVTISPLSIAKQ